MSELKCSKTALELPTASTDILNKVFFNDVILKPAKFPQGYIQTKITLSGSLRY